ncbi:hypothetical protein M3P05_13175 [Sansalvadorimonas sp. 2012CJ34-2]|uniref:Phospholipase/carboxylesterase/thioesterase domain-containing protein n=1 Tax=Parendozoicomonas callyspongiae TaxID=2942213 RepID=A0ABT0PHL8_9GAMM|nr:hypothetical protein [Sansalvadorimonas sp. 2012CJ34-2]MCL6270875.1 hypothetical protein [Sansalvadorimonas sp. 2012CJ34-2]
MNITRSLSDVFEKEILKTISFNYILHLTEGYESSDITWPLVLFLHGAKDAWCQR